MQLSLWLKTTNQKWLNEFLKSLPPEININKIHTNQKPKIGTSKNEIIAVVEAEELPPNLLSQMAKKLGKEQT